MVPPPASIGEEQQDQTSHLPSHAHAQEKMAAFVPATSAEPAPATFSMTGTAPATAVQQPFQRLSAYVARVKTAFGAVPGVGGKPLNDYCLKLETQFTIEAARRDWTKVPLPSKEEVEAQTLAQLSDESLLPASAGEVGQQPGRGGAPPAGVVVASSSPKANPQGPLAAAGGEAGGANPMNAQWQQMDLYKQHMMMQQFQMLQLQMQQLQQNGATPQQLQEMQMQFMQMQSQMQNPMGMGGMQQAAGMGMQGMPIAGGQQFNNWGGMQPWNPNAMQQQMMYNNRNGPYGGVGGGNSNSWHQNNPYGNNNSAGGKKSFSTAMGKNMPAPGQGGGASAKMMNSSSVIASSNPNMIPLGGGAGPSNGSNGTSTSRTGITSKVVPMDMKSGSKNGFSSGGFSKHFPAPPPPMGMTDSSHLVPTMSSGSSTAPGSDRFGRSGPPVLPHLKKSDSGMRGHGRGRRGDSRQRSRSRSRQRSRSRSRGSSRGERDGYHRRRRGSSRDRPSLSGAVQAKAAGLASVRRMESSGWNKWVSGSNASGGGAYPGGEEQPADRRSNKWKEWVRHEFERLLKAMGPHNKNVASDIMQHFQREHGVAAKRIKDVIGVPPGKYVGQLKLLWQNKPNIIDGSLKLEDVYNLPSVDNQDSFWDGGWGEDAAARERRQKREDRFKTSNAPVLHQNSAVSIDWDEDDEPFRASLNDEKPLVGTLDALCSEAEINDRESTRQLDRFEIRPGTMSASGDKAPVAERKLCVKKYQRSSADKTYAAKDIRTLSACWRSVEYLFTEVLTLDQKAEPTKFIFTEKIPYMQIYSFIRDRIRAIRVDLHVQQPLSTTTAAYIKTHEAAFRFELLSNFLVKADYVANLSTERKGGAQYDEKMALRAVSQTIEPLLHAYRQAREQAAEGAGGNGATLLGANSSTSARAAPAGGVVLKPAAKETNGNESSSSSAVDMSSLKNYVSPHEAAIRRYVMLMQLGNCEQVQSQLQKMDDELLQDARIREVVSLFGAYQCGDYAAFFQFYKNCDFLSTICLGGLIDVVRYRRLVCLVRACHPNIGDEIPLESLMEALCFTDEYRAREYFEFAGFKLATKKNVDIVCVPKREDVIKRKFLLQPNGQHHYLTRTAEIEEAMKPFYKNCGARDDILIEKYAQTRFSRADLVFGRADVSLKQLQVAQKRDSLAGASGTAGGSSKRGGEAVHVVPSPTPISTPDSSSD